VKRAAIAIASLVAAVLITLGALYLATGRTSSSAHASQARVQAIGGLSVGAPTWTTDTRDASGQASHSASAGNALRFGGPRPFDGSGQVAQSAGAGESALRVGGPRP
jgi:hypothetical protein